MFITVSIANKKYNINTITIKIMFDIIFLVGTLQVKVFSFLFLVYNDRDQKDQDRWT